MAGCRDDDGSPADKKQKLAADSRKSHLSEEAAKEVIKAKLEMDMPADFFDFWSFLIEENAEDPDSVLSTHGLLCVCLVLYHLFYLDWIL